MKRRVATQKQETNISYFKFLNRVSPVFSQFYSSILTQFLYLTQKPLWSVSSMIRVICELKPSIDIEVKTVASSICGKVWARCENVVIVVIGPLRSNTFSALSTDDENITDGKKNERETNRRSHPVVGDEVYGEIMNCLWSKLILKYWYIMSNY